MSKTKSKKYYTYLHIQFCYLLITLVNKKLIALMQTLVLT